MLEHFKFVIRMLEDDETQVKTLRMSSSSLQILMVNWEEIDDGSEMNITVKLTNLQRLTLSLKEDHKVNMNGPDLKYLSITSQVLELNLIQSFNYESSA